MAGQAAQSALWAHPVPLSTPSWAQDWLVVEEVVEVVPQPQTASLAVQVVQEPRAPVEAEAAQSQPQTPWVPAPAVEAAMANASL